MKTMHGASILRSIPAAGGPFVLLPALRAVYTDALGMITSNANVQVDAPGNIITAGAIRAIAGAIFDVATDSGYLRVENAAAAGTCGIIFANLAQDRWRISRGAGAATPLEFYSYWLSANAMWLSVAGQLTAMSFMGAGGAFFIRTAAPLNDGAGVGAGTLLNAPAAGNPTKWVGIDDDGVIRQIPAW